MKNDYFENVGSHFSYISNSFSTRHWKMAINVKEHTQCLQSKYNLIACKGHSWCASRSLLIICKCRNRGFLRNNNRFSVINLSYGKSILHPLGTLHVLEKKIEYYLSIPRFESKTKLKRKYMVRRDKKWNTGLLVHGDNQFGKVN